MVVLNKKLEDRRLVSLEVPPNTAFVYYNYSTALYPFLYALAYVCAGLEYCIVLLKHVWFFCMKMSLKDPPAVKGRDTSGARPATVAEVNTRKQTFYCFHEQACKHLRTALDMDEDLNKAGIISDVAERKRAVLIDKYWCSVTALEKASQYFLNNIDPTSRCKVRKAGVGGELTDAEVQRARSTYEKMQSNKLLATDRICRLETAQRTKDLSNQSGSSNSKNDASISRHTNNACPELSDDDAERQKTSRGVPVVILDDGADDDDGFGLQHPPILRVVESARKPVGSGSRATSSRSRPAVVAPASKVTDAKALRKTNISACSKVAADSSYTRSPSNNSLKTGLKAVSGKKPEKPQPAGDIKAEARKALRGVDRELVDRILDNVLQMDDKIALCDVQGQEPAKQALYELVILPAIRPEIFTGLRAPIGGLLLFGPPGNGKTMLAKAVASEAGLRFFNISASALVSKWIGEGEKLVRALFACAKLLQPAVIFVDELDSLLKSRSDSEHDSMRRLKTEFLIQFDGVASSSADRVLVMGATNRPFELDDAAIRRFPKRVYVQLPDAAVRQSLLERLLHDQQHSITSRQLKSLAAATEGYSGSDLTNLARDAALGPVRIHSADVLKKINISKLRPITEQDFLDSLRKIRPSCSDELVQQLEQWNSKFGEVR